MSISNCYYTFSGDDWDDVSEEARDLISKLLVLEPHKRLKSDQILDHPWFKLFDE